MDDGVGCSTVVVSVLNENPLSAAPFCAIDFSLPARLIYLVAAAAFLKRERKLLISAVESFPLLPAFCVSDPQSKSTSLRGDAARTDEMGWDGEIRLG